jgi:cell division protein FtsQ
VRENRGSSPADRLRESREGGPRGVQTHIQGVTVGQKRRDVRRATRARRGMGLATKMGIVLVILAVLAIAAVLIYQSSLFTITQVRVVGAQRLTSEYLTQLAAVPAGSTELRIDTAGIEQRLTSDPWVQSASIQREFPSTIVLSITERPITARVQIYPDAGSTQTTEWLISGDGMWLGATTDVESSYVQVDPAQVAALPSITDVARTAQPVRAQMATDGGILNALAILNGLSSNMVSQIASIDAPSAVATTLTLTNNIGIAFGTAEDIQAKETAINTLMTDHPGTLTYINVRVPDRATYRATS